MRGADKLVSGLKAAGVRRLFGLSGNHIMVVFDALLGSGIELIHTRTEAAAVHMADAYARLSGEVGVALVTGGQGHANAVAALCTAQAGEVPLLLLSGHAPLGELGLGAFQETPQVALAAPLCKAAWEARSAATLEADIARALRLAHGGRPGPVHVSLPTDVLEAAAEPGPPPPPDTFAPPPMPLPPETARLVAGLVAAAERPVLVAPPALCTPAGAAALAALSAAAGLPVVPMQAPRGLADPSLGVFAELLAEADLVVLLGKPLDFTLRFGRATGARFVVIDPEAALLARAARLLGERLVLAAIAAPTAAVAALAPHLAPVPAQAGWAGRLAEALAWRPAEWPALAARTAGAVHPAALCAALQAALEVRPGAVFVNDGGEVGQWGLGAVRPETRVLNGVAGAIGVALPFAIGAKAARPEAAVIALSGDGAFGFHMAEIETALRARLPVVVVVGNDSRWNAEHQIQLRDYGANRAHGCDITPGLRYDRVAEALGGHGEWVREAPALAPALARALDQAAAGRPALVNVDLAGAPAPLLRRNRAPA